MQKYYGINFWVCMGGAWANIMLAFLVMDMFHHKNLAMLFWGSALAFVVGAICFWAGETQDDF
jgi:hypothetical protein